MKRGLRFRPTLQRMNNAVFLAYFIFFCTFFSNLQCFKLLTNYKGIPRSRNDFIIIITTIIIIIIKRIICVWSTAFFCILSIFFFFFIPRFYPLPLNFLSTPFLKKSNTVLILNFCSVLIAFLPPPPFFFSLLLPASFFFCSMRLTFPQTAS